jgi:hypothetical protein
MAREALNHCVFTEISRLDGIEATRRLQASSSAVKVSVLTTFR